MSFAPKNRFRALACKTYASPLAQLPERPAAPAVIRAIIFGAFGVFRAFAVFDGPITASPTRPAPIREPSLLSGLTRRGGHSERRHGPLCALAPLRETLPPTVRKKLAAGASLES